MRATELGIYWELLPPSQKWERLLRKTAFEVLSMEPSEFARQAELVRVYDDDVLVQYKQLYVTLLSRPAGIRVADRIGHPPTRNYYVAYTRRAGRLRRAVLKKAKVGGKVEERDGRG